MGVLSFSVKEISTETNDTKPAYNTVVDVSEKAITDSDE
ncbi:hypothetical protein J2W48_001126 [Flavobacterium piscis]|uniref:Uncharacterized protein n=1 Tax=Flavobacterium piscis TaxID=1114874 RepID=A0ABU1Y549_9FLAO|nr:hypothetical protein [Flavobacterium piscis]